MPNTMNDDLLSGVINNYYRGPEGEIIRVFAIELPYRGRPATPYFRASIVRELQPTKDVVQGEVEIPLLTHKLIEYKRIPEPEIQELRNKKNKLEIICQTS